MKVFIKNFQHLASVIESLESARYLAVDVETTGKPTIDEKGNIINPGSGLDMLDAEVIGFGFADKHNAWYIDLPWLKETLYKDHPMGKQKFELAVWRAIYDICDTSKHILIAHHVPFDMYHLRKGLKKFWARNETMWPDCQGWWDTLSLAALCNENLIGVRVALPQADGTLTSIGALSLKALSQVYLGRTQRLYTPDFLEWPIEERTDYACDDVRNCYDLAIVLSRHLHKEELLRYYVQTVAPQGFVAEAMERNGIKVDVAKLKEVKTKVTAEARVWYEQVVDIVPPIHTYKYGLAAPWTKAKFVQLAEDKHWVLPTTRTGKPSVTAKILQTLAEEYKAEWDWALVRELVTTPFNPKSNIQLGNYLASFEGYRLPVTPTGKHQVTEDSLKALAEAHPENPIWEPLFKMRKLEKLLSTYVSGVLKVVWPDDTVHPQWNSSGTVTGRYSCTGSKKNKELAHKRGPALQTIPRPDTIEEAGWDYNPREWYTAHEGNVLIVADLSQAEVRMLAVVSGDQALFDAIMAGGDLHTQNARAIYGNVFENANDHEQATLRRNAKTVTFGTMYGGGPNMLMEKLRITKEAAIQVIKDFYNAFPGVKEWKAEETTFLHRNGYVETYLGRRRSPVIIQAPPRVTAHPKKQPKRRAQQKAAMLLWQACYDTALAKAKLSAEEETTSQRKGRAVRQAINFEIQGSVGEMMNRALWKIVRAGYTLRAQIHDEVIIEVKDDPKTIERATDFLKSIFEVVVEDIPFVLDVAVGKSWACGKK